MINHLENRWNMANNARQQYLVISGLGEDRPGIVNDLSEQVLHSGANILDSRMTRLGGEFAILMLVEGNWNAIAKLEHGLPALQQSLRLTITTRRTRGEAEPAARQEMPYTVDVVSIDHPGIVNQLAGFFSRQNINIQDMYTDSYRAAHTGTRMFSVTMTIGIPESINIARLRDEFLEFCDSLNLDAVLEPLKR
jgi:glycine cleavage system transcriptional repressor